MSPGLWALTIDRRRSSSDTAACAMAAAASITAALWLVDYEDGGESAFYVADQQDDAALSDVLVAIFGAEAIGYASAIEQELELDDSMRVRLSRAFARLGVRGARPSVDGSGRAVRNAFASRRTPRH